jgi:hypothetical protein
VPKPSKVPVHEDVRRYLKAQHNLNIPRGGQYCQRRLENLVTQHARRLVEDARRGIFNGEEFPLRWEGPPFRVEQLASLLGHKVINEKPPTSEEAELHPWVENPGSYIIYCNPELSKNRQNFGIAHELGHTIIPPFDLKVRKRERLEITEEPAYLVLEKLCNLAASEILMPSSAFLDHVEKYGDLNCDTWAKLSEMFGASREAVGRRIVNLSETPVAFVRLSNKLKPTELRDACQYRLFGDGPEEKLRVDYCCRSEQFEFYFPKDKSVPEDSPLITVYNKEEEYSGVMEFEIDGKMQTFHTEACFAYGGGNEDQVLALVWNAR